MSNQHNRVRYALVGYVVRASNRAGGVEAVCKVGTEQGKGDQIGDAAMVVRTARNSNKIRTSSPLQKLCSPVCPGQLLRQI